VYNNDKGVIEKNSGGNKGRVRVVSFIICMLTLYAYVLLAGLY
jgi:hypothetical protein